MARCTERARRAPLLLVLWALAPGCFTGHLLDAARRRDRPVAVRAAWLEADALVLRWDVEVTTDLGRRLGDAERAGAIPLAALAGSEPLAADVVPLQPRPPAAAPAAHAVAVAVLGERAACTADAPPDDAPSLATRPDPDGTLLVLREGAHERAAIPLGALARAHTSRWAWPLLPFAIAADVVVVPPLLLLAPLVIVPGD